MTGRRSGSPHVEPLLGAYVLGALVPQEEARVAGHLTHCGRCRAVYLGMADAQALRTACAEEDGLDGGIARTGGSGGAGWFGGLGGLGGLGWFGGTGRSGGTCRCGGGGRTR